eukprot:1360438-Ditylum_brightwellii.AAC.2
MHEKIKECRGTPLEEEGGHATQEKFCNVDTTFYCRSSVNRENWKNTTDIPSGKELTKSMDVKQEAQQHDKTKVKAYVTLITNLQLNALNFEST